MAARYLFTIERKHLKRSPRQLREAIGRVLVQDIGKRVYDAGDDVWQVENDEQMRRRTGTNPRRRSFRRTSRRVAAVAMARSAKYNVPRSRVHHSRASSAVRRGARRRNSVATRYNPSETAAWKSVKAIGQYIYNNQNISALFRRDGKDLVELADTMLAQLARGVHENPTLAVLGNPPAKVVGTLSRRLYELRYKHASDGKDYRHPFGPGASVKLLADGSVWITSRKRLWEDL